MSDGALLHRIGESRRFRFADAACLAASCFDPCVVEDALTKKEIACCRTRMMTGCPRDQQHSVKSAHTRSTNGWRVEPRT
jgi:hypothetical protein